MTVKINIKGSIISNDDKWIYELFEMEATCPKDVIERLPENGEDVEVTINSYGGLVDEGNEIYTALKLYGGKVAINVIMAGSAASVIAMAGNPTRITPPGQIMIHNVSMGAGGDYHDMDKASEILQKANESLAFAYRLKTGMNTEDILDKMNKETWLTAEEAKELGFVDEIMFENETQLKLVASKSPMIPMQIVNRVKKLKTNNPTNSPVLLMDEEKIKAIVSEELEKNNKPKESEMENNNPFTRFFF